MDELLAWSCVLLGLVWGHLDFHLKGDFTAKPQLGENSASGITPFLHSMVQVPV